MKRLALLLALGMTIAACGGSELSGSVEGAWQLESGTHGGEPIPIVASHPITMTLESGQIGGTAACNGYGGEYQLSGTEFSIEGGLAVTEMACGPDEVMESERRFLEGLAEVGSVELENETLVLSAGATDLTFTPLPPVPTAELTGTVWVLDGLIQGDAVSSPVAGERATVELLTDGSFIGSTGCRTISGTYQITGAEVQFTNWGADGECTEELREQDSRVISALEGGFRVEIEGARMTTWVAGDEGLVYRDAS